MVSFITCAPGHRCRGAGLRTLRRALLAGTLLVAGLSTGAGPASAQDRYFGQNKVQYKDFEWKVFKTRNFEFYYHQGGEEIAEFAAVASEQAYERLSRDYRFELSHRIPIILYNSHNDFQQTNVTPGILQEGIGGFTEFLKHRVVVPFEGSYDNFRHVLHHELVHAVSMAMIHGTGVASLISQAQSVALPLWFVEGLAEYESMGWDLDADAFLRDAVITGYLPPLNQIYGGILAYKGGQSFFHYLAETYGRGRIGEVLSNVRLIRNLDRAFVAAVGKPVDELSQDWHRYLRRTYWPEIENRKLPDEFASPLTDHVEEQSTYNVFPTLSPAGDKVAYISNRDEYMDLYVASSLDGARIARLGKGEQVGKFEEMHILRGGVSWNPDGDQLAVAAKSGHFDQIFLIDSERGKIMNEINPEMDGVFEPAWSPDGRHIAFVGISEGYSDLYLYEIETGMFTRLTESRASESEPAWSRDGTRLAFASDYLIPSFEAKAPGLPVEYGPKNIWVMEMASGDYRIEPVIVGPFEDSNPIWGANDREMAYVSFRSGVRNLYLRELESGEERPLTNILTGIESAHWSTESNSLVFSAFNGAGFDVFLMKDPTARRVPDAISTTRLLERLERERLAAATQPSGFAPADTIIGLGDLSRLRFRPIPTGYGEYVEEPAETEEVVLNRDLGSGVLATDSRPYRLKMTPDLFFANASYYSFWGLAGSSYMEMSDILGNHRIAMMTSLWSSLDNSNYQMVYTYLGRRLNFGTSLLYYNYFYLPERRSRAIYADRNMGFSLMVSYPFSRFHRVDAELFYLGIYRRIFETGPAERSYRQVAMPRVHLVSDNTVPGVTGYISGRRYSVTLSHSPTWLSNSLNFSSIVGDYRSYSKLGRDNSFVFRLAAGGSSGPSPQQFFIGGNGYWWGPQSASSDLYDINNLYFASFESPLRAYDFYEFSGSHFALMNLEFRFPLIRMLATGWPLPIVLPNIRGALFMDMGMVWDGYDVEPFDPDASVLGFRDIKSGVGLGARMNLGFLILRLDVAWKNTLEKISGRPRWYIALGPEF
jgi:Tol biopolymer transport system component